jgi:hypothetical protein
VIGEPPHGAARFVDTSGVAGIGKTEFISHVARTAAERGMATLALVVDQVSCPTNVTDAYATFHRDVRRLAKRVTALSGRPSLEGEFENELAVIEQQRLLEIKNAVDAGGATITNATVASVNIAGEIAGIVCHEKASAIRAAFERHFRNAFKRTPLVVTVDGFDRIAGSALADWLLDVLDGLSNTLVILGRTSVAAAPGLTVEQTVSLPLPPFTCNEVGELLALYLGREPDPTFVEAVYVWSGGHPGSAALVARFLASRDDSGAATLEERFRTPPKEFEVARAELTVAFVATLSGEAGSGDLSRASAVPRVFNEELLARVVGHDLPPRGVEVLQLAGLVEPVGEEGAGDFRVHGFIREPLLKLLPEKLRKQMHRRAAAYYYDLLQEEEPELDARAAPYDAWYRYETPEWQAKLREWLYHLHEGANTDNEKQRARMQFARIFLDAFWWWGCYMEFPFCGDLLTDWEHVNADNSAWVADLRRFLASYPTGWRKEASTWADVEAALIAIRRECGIDSDAGSLRGQDARHTRALVDNFLAHACRYRDVRDDAQRRRLYERAVRYYDESTQLLERDDDVWELAWTLFETAELHADYAEPATAREVWLKARAAALDVDDREVSANLHRLRADLRWQAGDVAEAFAAHTRAVLHAYLFQCMTPSHRPDAYTVAFYEEQVERTADRLRELDAAALAAAVETLREPFETDATADDVAAALAGDPRSLAGTLFPAPPRADELLATRSPLTERIDLLCERLPGDFRRDLADVEP